MTKCRYCVKTNHCQNTNKKSLYKCTRVIDHKGKHVACANNYNEHILAKW